MWGRKGEESTGLRSRRTQERGGRREGGGRRREKGGVVRRRLKCKGRRNRN